MNILREENGIVLGVYDYYSDCCICGREDVPVQVINGYDVCLDCLSEGRVNEVGV